MTQNRRVKLIEGSFVDLLNQIRMGLILRMGFIY